MSVRTHYKLIGAAGAAALALGALAGPALAAASTASVAYTCSDAVRSRSTRRPSTTWRRLRPRWRSGSRWPPRPRSRSMPATTGPSHLGLGWTSFNGTITTKPSATQAGLSLKVKKTTLGNGAGATTVAPATGSTLAGTKVGTFTFKLGNLGRCGPQRLRRRRQPGWVRPSSRPLAAGIGRCINDAGTDHRCSMA